MMIRFSFCFLILLLLTVKSSFAQDFHKDYELFLQKMKKSNTVIFQAKVNIINSEDAMVKQQSIVYQKNQTSFFYSNGFMETFSDYKINLMVDYASKVVVWSEIQEKNDEDYIESMLIKDSMYKYVDSIIYKGEENSSKCYELFLKRTSIKSIIISFSLQTGLLNYLKYNYVMQNQQPIKYSEVQISKFSTESEVIIVSKKLSDYLVAGKTTRDYSLSSSYKGYQLIYFDEKTLR